MGDTTENTTETFLLRLGGGGGIVAFDAPRRAAGVKWQVERGGGDIWYCCQSEYSARW